MSRSDIVNTEHAGQRTGLHYGDAIWQAASLQSLPRNHGIRNIGDTGQNY